MALLLALGVSCGSKVDLSTARLTVSLEAVGGRSLVVDQTYQVHVEVVDGSGEPLAGLEVHAEVYDDAGVSLGRFPCQPVSEARGQYRSQSTVFCPAAAAAGSHCVPGTWRIRATAVKGESAAEASLQVAVAPSLSALALATHGFYVAIPPTWNVLSERHTAEGGELLLDPLPGDERRGLLAIYYVEGEHEVSKEALQAYIASYAPPGYDPGQARIRQAIELDMQGNPGYLVRGDLLTSQGNTAYNLTLQAYRFYCAPSRRTFTAVALSTDDATVSKAAAVLDTMRCAGAE